MNNYDEWKQYNKDEPKSNFCDFCGEPCENKYCSRACKKEYERIKH